MRDKLDVHDSENSLTAVIDADMIATKSILLDNPGESLEAFWEDGDKIGVFGGDAKNVMFQVNEYDLSVDRKTAAFKTSGEIPGGNLTAYSPYSGDVAVKDGSIVVNFPAVQEYILVNGVVQPDPAANFMFGEGSRGTGLVFRSATSILKIGQIFPETTVVTKVEFRDLSGAPVCGEMTLGSGDGILGKIIGSGTVITLQLGNGVEFIGGSMKPLFITVPARDYGSGFELTFIDDKGGKTVKTVGKAKGKSLSRGVVYLIGDINSSNQIEGVETKLKDNAILMTSDVLDKVQVIDVTRKAITGPDGSVCFDPVTNRSIVLPYLKLRVHEDINPAVGKILLFNHTSADLPSGGSYRIASCEKVDGHYYEVAAEPELNIAAGIEELIVGTPLVGSDGSIIEDGGIELDLSSSLRSIKDADGNDISFALTPGGEILFSQDETSQMLASMSTKGQMHKTFSPPKVSLKHSKANAEVSFGAQLTLATKLALGIMQGELQYVHFVAEPEFNLSADFTLKGEASVSKSFDLLTLDFAPIPCGAVILTPRVSLSAEIGLGGDLTFSASTSYTYKMGTYGISYNRGDGLNVRYRPAEPEPSELNPSIGGLYGSVYASGSLSATPWIGVYGMFGIGAKATFSLKAGLGYNGAPRLFLEPGLEVVPMVASLGGLYTHNFTDLTTVFEFDPIWERYLYPRPRYTNCTYVSIPQSEKYYDFPLLRTDDPAHGGTIMKVNLGADKWSYKVTLEEEVSGSYSLEARIMQTTNVVNDISWFNFGSYHTDIPVERYVASGIPHMYPFVKVFNQTMYEPGNCQSVYKKVLGTYESGTKTKTFEGYFDTPSTTVKSGHVYWGALYLVWSEGEVLIYRDTNNAKVYYFPTDFHGSQYREPVYENNS